MRSLALASMVCVLTLGFGAPAFAQQTQKLPENPSPAADAKIPEPSPGDALYAPLAVGDRPESFKFKFESYLVVSFGPRAIVSPAFSAAIKMARPPKYYPREWKDGAEAFGRNYGDAFARKVATQTARFAVGAALHEDFRYRRAKAEGFGRVTHAIGYVFVDANDYGHRRLAYANYAGAAAGAFTPNLYLPDGNNSAGNGAVRFGTHFISFAVQNVLREYSPEIAHLFGGHFFPHLPVPEWYTKNLEVLHR